MRLLAQIGMKLDVTDDAELLLENVLLLAPDYHAARYEYAQALLTRHKHVRARQEMEKLLEIDPNNRAYRTTHATVCTGFGDYTQALPVYREILAETPGDPELHLSIAHALKTLGRTQEAIESYRAAAAARPRYGEAYWSLANLKVYRFRMLKSPPCGPARRRPRSSRSTGIIFVSRWERRSRIGTNTRNRSLSTSAATR